MEEQEQRDFEIHREQMTQHFGALGRRIGVPWFQAKWILSLEDVICNKPVTQQSLCSLIWYKVDLITEDPAIFTQLA